MAFRLLARALVCTTAICVLAADVAHAGTVTLYDTGRRDDNFGGGEFGVSGYTGPLYSPVGDDPSNTDSYVFHTFCLEVSEHFNLGTEYTYTIDRAAIGGGGGAVDGSDPLSKATAMLYFTFWTNQWSVASSFGNDVAINYDYTTGSGGEASSKALQQAIWYLEGETSSVSGMAADMVQYVTQAGDSVDWSNLAGATDWTDIGLVRVMNLYTSTGVLRQSQLVVVPLPAAAIMGFAMLGSMGFVSLLRRRRQNTVA